MKRKIFSILLALVLVLSFSLVTAVPVAAQGVVEEFQSSGLGEGWVKWAPEEANTGDYSVLLGLVDPTNEARVAVPVTMAFADLTSLSYWYYIKTATLDTVPDAALKDSTEPDFEDFTPVPGYAAPYAVIELDLDGEEGPDAWVVEARYADDSIGAWEQRSMNTTNYFHAAGGGVPAELALPNIVTLADIKAHAFFADADVLKVKVMMGDWHAYITNSPEAYVDDVAVNLVAYPLEPKAVVNIDAKWPAQGVAGDTSYDTIQAAIDDALSGQTILAAAGTYVENVVIDIPLTLQGAQAGVDPTVEGARIAPAEESTIDGAGNLGPGVHITATDVTFVGFTVTNFTCTPSSGMGALWVVGDGAIISENIIYNIPTQGDPIDDPAGIGIDMAANDAYVTLNLVHDVGSIGIRARSRYEEGDLDTVVTGVRVEDNTVYNTGNSGVLVCDYISDVTIRGNEIYNSLPPTPYSLLICPGWGAYSPTNVLIEGNTISGGYGNVCLGGATNVTVTGNTISGAIPHYSNPDIKGKNIYIRDWAEVTTTNVTITNNDITNADGWGVYVIDAGTASTTTINFNNISGNTIGVENTDTANILDAYVNWWGDISGPECVASTVDAVNPGGIGDKVSDYVYYLPWLTRHFQTVLADNIAYFGIPMVYLNAGWNTFSTPVALDSACDTWGEYVTLGDYLAIHATSPAYAFDGVAQDWVPLNADYRLKPCDAIYVRMAEPDIAAILYSPDVSVPSKDLYAGWNLVSLAYDPEGEQDLSVPAVYALDTVYEVTGDLTGYSLVVSPPVNMSPWFVLRDYLTDEQMYITEGYWVFMKNPGTLAGFSQTPVPLPMP